MSLFQKKRGRPAKMSPQTIVRNTQKILKISGIAIFSLCIGIGIFIAYSFSSFFFLIPKSYDLLGMGDNKKTYLITLHNDGELRPALGFLTGFIFLEMENGKINLEFHDSYDISPPENSQKILAPEIIEERFSKDPRYQGWVFRDANFSPLHAENSQKILDFLKYDSRYKNKKIDAVISLDLHALGIIIDSVGGVEFSGNTITSQDIFSVLETEAKTFDFHSEKEWLARKNSIKPLAQEIFKTLAFSPLHWREFSETIEKLGQEKHFLVYFRDEKVQKLFSSNAGKNWAGDFNQPENSFLLGHNIANLGGKKGDRYISKDFSSLFSVSARGKISEKLSLRLQHNGTRNLHSDKYFAFIRIFREKGAVLEKFSGEFVNIPQKIQNPEKKSLTTSDHSSKEYEEFQFFIAIDESSEKTFSLDFSYPNRIFTKKLKINNKINKKTNNKTQEFYIFSQAGKNSDLETYSLVFQAEGDASFQTTHSSKNLENASQSCDTTLALENILTCKITSSGDKNISLEMIPDTRKPILEEIIPLENGQKLRLQFNEEIQEIYPSSVHLQEKVTGQNSEISDIQKEKRALVITLKNPMKKNHPFNTGEKNFYKIYIDDISDLSGNSISPFVMTVNAR